MVKRLTQLFAKQPYAGSNPTRASQPMTNPEYEKKGYKDETGFSEKQLDIAIEAGVFRKKRVKKTPFEKKPKK
ncbi:MAG: hypothetical protein HW400_454 [Candidatus Levybacteria bacterium]|nr:hypothetical protein [Candidatus Levybacteria bacterium]